jgi:DNA repair protein RecO (recombination protein O)
MPQKQSEAIVLRTYPLREADLLVTFFTRAEGKVKGVAKSAMRSRKRFGGALEPLTQVRVYYEDKEKRELARIDSCDVLQSPLSSAIDYGRAAALAHVAEVVDELLPDREANDAVFRLTSSVLSNMKAGAIWMPLTYFDLWMTRLAGFLPELHVCVQCGAALDSEKAWFHVLVDGLMCVDDKRLASSELTWESRKLAAEMFRAPVDVLAKDIWPKKRGADLRKFLVQIMERHLDKKLVTAHSLERIE